MTDTTLITGADGYVGSGLAKLLLATGDDHLVLAVRAAEGSDRLAGKRAYLAKELGEQNAARYSVVPADLSLDDTLDLIDPEPITRIVHTAAVTKYNVERELAQAVNIDGTARIAAFAARCDNLQRFALLSTLYAVGRRKGDVPEQGYDDSAGFVNNYEWSKWSAEDLVTRKHADLPVSILRLPNVIADDDSGRVVQQNSFHNTLKLYYYGLLSLVPGDRRTRQFYATGQFTLAAILRLIDPAVPAGFYHTAPHPEATAPLEDVVEAIFGVFENDRSYQRRKLLRPLYCERESFFDLVEASKVLRSGPIYDALDSVIPFAEQLFLPKDFRNDALRAVWPQYDLTDPVELVARTAADLVASRWGRRTQEE
jgi:nucleoside-diphosphate-sugar epimerase